MTQSTARIKKAGKHFEILVDLDKALAYKKGQSQTVDFLEIDRVFSDIKKGNVPSSNDLMTAFKTEDVQEIASKIVKEGEVLETQEHRDAAQDQRIKQVIDFLAKNAVDPQTRNPITAERLKTALNEARINITNKPIETQIPKIIEDLSKILPIKFETKKVKIKIPSRHIGQIYGLVNQYKEKEKWLDNGDLDVVVAVPSGILMDFYDKLNNVTHGAAVTEEIRE